MTLAEVRKVSTEFRQVVSRALGSNSDTATVNLRRLLKFVAATPLLAEQVRAAPAPAVDPLEELERVRDQYDHLVLSDEPAEELGFLHALLTALADHPAKDFYQLTYCYGGKTGLKESIRELLHDTMKPYYDLLNRAVEHMLIDQSEAERGSGNNIFHISGGTSQINVARDQGRIVAKQEMRPEVDEVLDRARTLLTEIERQRGTNIDPAALDDLQELSEAVVEQVEQPRPRKKILAVLGGQLKSISGMVRDVDTLANAANGLVEGLQKLIG